MVIFGFLDEQLLSDRFDENFRHGISLVKAMLFHTRRYPDVNDMISASVRDRYMNLLLDLARSVDRDVSSQRFDALQMLDHILEPLDMFKSMWRIWREIGLEIPNDEDYSRWITAMMPYMERQEWRIRETVRQELQMLINSDMSRISSRAFSMETILGLR